MMSIKNLAILKKKNPQKDNNTIIKNNDKKIDESICKTKGYEKSIKVNGSPIDLKVSLNNLYHDFKDKERINIKRQEEFKKPYKEKLNKKEAEKKGKEIYIDIRKEKIENINKEIDKYKNEIAEVRNNPEKFGIDPEAKKSKVHFYIGLLILLPLTLYLFVFYISASFSAFFKQFTDDDLMAAVFDGHALSKAMEQGVLEAIFVGTIPFVFMGLGYLIHMFQKQKGTGIYKLMGLLGVTFIFDALLAYQIEKKIYDFERTPTSPDFDFQIAFTRPEFWTIIFAGFIVYLIWGLVFDFIMKEHQEFDKINSFIRTQKEKIENLISNKNNLNKEIEKAREEISTIDSKISEYQTIIEGFIFNKKDFLNIHSAYLEGWLEAISSEIALPHEKKEDLKKECLDTSNMFLDEIGNKDTDTIIFINDKIENNESNK